MEISEHATEKIAGIKDEVLTKKIKIDEPLKFENVFSKECSISTVTTKLSFLKLYSYKSMQIAISL